MKKKVIKPFDIEKAKNGAKICTRDGCEVRIVCFDVDNTKYPLLSLITSDKGYEVEARHTQDGKYIYDSVNNNSNDLMLIEYEEEKSQFKAFDKVLVRDTDNENWRCEVFSHYIESRTYSYVCISSAYIKCIPFEGNEHLVGTNNNP